MPSALVLLAEGFEEIETAAIVDVLRRAEVEVVLVGLEGDHPVTGSREMVFVPDVGFDDSHRNVDAVVLPGGSQGAERLAGDARVRALLRDQTDSGRLVAAICAAPIALDEAGVLPENGFTCYPGVEARIRTQGRQHAKVVESGSIITSQGPGTALDFALTLVAHLCGRARAVEVGRDLLHPLRD